MTLHPHGTVARYQHGACRCDLCKQAKSIQYREWRERNGLVVGKDIVPCARLAPIIERNLASFDGVYEQPHDFYGMAKRTNVELANMAEQVARSTGRRFDSVIRALRNVRSGQGAVTFNKADWILSGLGLTHLWLGELLDLYELHTGNGKTEPAALSIAREATGSDERKVAA